MPSSAVEHRTAWSVERLMALSAEHRVALSVGRRVALPTEALLTASLRPDGVAAWNEEDSSDSATEECATSTGAEASREVSSAALPIGIEECVTSIAAGASREEETESLPAASTVTSVAEATPGDAGRDTISGRTVVIYGPTAEMFSGIGATFCLIGVTCAVTMPA